MVIEISNENEFYQRINNRHFKATIVKFYAKWCNPCQVIAPFFEQLSFKYPDLQFLAVDIELFRILAAYNGVYAMPTFCVYKNGVKTQDSILGAKRDDLERIVHFYATQIPDDFYATRNYNNYSPSNKYLYSENDQNFFPRYEFSAGINNNERHKNDKNFFKKCVIL